MSRWRSRMLTAAAACAACACGDGLSVPDAPPTPDAPGGLVRVSFASDRAGPGGHEVYFQAAGGALVLATVTASDGTASAWMQPGGSVTVVEELADGRRMFTLTDVVPDEPLVIGAAPAIEGARRAFQVRLPRPSSPTLLWSPCGGPFDVTGADAAPIAIEVAACPPVTDLLVTSPGGSEYLFVPAATLTGTVTFPDPPALATRAHVTVRGLPPEPLTASITQALIDGGRVASPTVGAQLPVTGGEASGQLDLALPLPATSTLRTQVAPGVFDVAPAGFPYTIDWRPATAELTLDVTAEAVRALTSRPAFDAATGVVRWTEAATGRAADGAFIRLAWFDAVGTSTSWSVSAARGEAPAIQLPILPRDDLHPTAFTSVLEMTTYVVPGGFPAIRGRLREFEIDWPVRGPSGTISYRQL